MSYDSDDNDCAECRELYGRTRVPCKYGEPCPYGDDECCDEEEEWSF